MGASFLSSFGNAGGRRRDTDKLIRLNGIDRWGWKRERQDQKVDVKKSDLAVDTTCVCDEFPYLVQKEMIGLFCERGGDWLGEEIFNRQSCHAFAIGEDPTRGAEENFSSGLNRFQH